MIQRIQTLWLLLSSILFGLEYLSKWSFAQTLNAGPSPLDDRILQTSENFTMTLGSCLSSILAFMAVFWYKNRGGQIILSGISGLVQTTLYLAWGFFVIYKAGMLNEFRADFAAYLGLVGLFTNWLATRAIRKDMGIVKSMDRLR